MIAILRVTTKLWLKTSVHIICVGNGPRLLIHVRVSKKYVCVGVDPVWWHGCWCGADLASIWCRHVTNVALCAWWHVTNVAPLWDLHVSQLDDWPVVPLIFNMCFFISQTLVTVCSTILGTVDFQHMALLIFTTWHLWSLTPIAIGSSIHDTFDRGHLSPLDIRHLAQLIFNMWQVWFLTCCNVDMRHVATFDFHTWRLPILTHVKFEFEFELISNTMCYNYFIKCK